MFRKGKATGLFLTAILLAMLPPAPAMAGGSIGEWYPIDNIPNCKFWVPFSGKESSVKWTGKCVGGFVHGNGVLQFKKGSFEGDFRNGKLQGLGVLVSMNAFRYEGEFQDTGMHGKGVLVVKDMYRYEGEFKNNGKDGYGIQEFADGSRYEGQYLDDWRHGHGIWTLRDEKKCEGEWDKGQLVGLAKGWVNGQLKACVTEDYAVKFLD